MDEWLGAIINSEVENKPEKKMGWFNGILVSFESCMVSWLKNKLEKVYDDDHNIFKSVDYRDFYNWCLRKFDRWCAIKDEFDGINLMWL